MLKLDQACFVRPPYLQPLSGTIKAHQLVAIVGPNGAGKSTLLQMLSGFRAPEQGAIYLHGQPLDTWTAIELATQRALVAQQSVPVFDWSVMDLVSLGHSVPKDVMLTILHWLDIAHLQQRGVQRLSGGERQRVMIARALGQLVTEPATAGASSEMALSGLLLLDEPTSALDLGQQQRLMRCLRQLTHTQPLAVVCVLHDLNLAARYADQVWLLDQGQCLAMGPPKEVLDVERLSQIYHADLEWSHHADVPLLALKT